MTLQHYQSTVDMKGTSAYNTLPIEGLMDETNLSQAFPRLSPSNRRIVDEITFKLLELQAIQDPHGSPLQALDLVQQIPNWLNSLLAQGKSPATLNQYSYYVKEFLHTFPKPTPILIDAFLATKSGSGLSPHTLANRVHAIKSFFACLESAGTLLDNPAYRIKAPPRPHRETVIPSPADVARLLDSPAATTRDKALILLLAGCGLRRQEATTLRRSDVDLTRKCLQVIGKGNKQRTVPMPLHTASAVSHHIAQLPPTSPWLFPGKNPSKSLTPKYVDELFLNLCSKAQIPRIKPHHLRHLYASTLLNAGVSLKIVSGLLGHSSPAITASVYWHLLDATAHQKAIQEHDPLAQIQSARQE